MASYMAKSSKTKQCACRGMRNNQRIENGYLTTPENSGELVLVRHSRCAYRPTMSDGRTAIPWKSITTFNEQRVGTAGTQITQNYKVIENYWKSSSSPSRTRFWVEREDDLSPTGIWYSLAAREFRSRRLHFFDGFLAAFVQHFRGDIIIRYIYHWR